VSQSPDKPLPGSPGILGRLRGAGRRGVLDLLQRALSTDDSRSAARRAILDAPVRSAEPGLRDQQRVPTEYAERAVAPGDGARTALRSDIVFVSARFRSGSTLLWNLFRNAPGFTAYYEPFNERRWFDPATRGSHTDPTHRNVDDYWREYQGLEELARWWDPSWHDRHLFLPAGAWQPDMKRFVEVLAERAPARPVLQFNRVDLRLPWLRREFPNATLLHLYRHPRDQWVSALLDPAKFRSADPAAAFAAHDHFYVRAWARDLKHAFPFLDERRGEHPYRTFYWLWKLSYLFGRRYADHSLSFESLVGDPEPTLARLNEALGLPAPGLIATAGLVTPARIGRWRDWADDAWFKAHEAECEKVLAEFLDGG
jgi:hypothetical protein